MTLPDTATRAKAREIARTIVRDYDAAMARHLKDDEHLHPRPVLAEVIASHIEALLSSGEADGEPVAWRVHDFADGWVLFRNKETAYAEANETGLLVEPLYRHPAPREALPADVRALVIAARIVSLEDQSPDARKRLDVAAEAFADRVPWDDEPDSELASPVLGSE